MTREVPASRFIFGWSVRRTGEQPCPSGRQGTAGFTLIEMVVTLGIMTLVLGAALLNLQSSNAHQQLRHAAEDVRLMIYQAHNFALAPEPFKDRSSDRYRFQTILPNQYQILEVGTRTGETAVIRVVKEMTLPEGITFTGSGGVGLQVDFSIIDQGRIVAPDSLAQPTAVMTLRRVRPPEDQLQLIVQLLTGQVEVVE